MQSKEKNKALDRNFPAALVYFAQNTLGFLFDLAPEVWALVPPQKPDILLSMKSLRICIHYQPRLIRK